MLGIPIALLYANATEWVVHKYILHGLGKEKDSFWSFHWHEHHKHARKAGGYDFDYEQPLGNNPQGKEAITLTALVSTHLPLLPIAPFFYGTLVYSAINYYRKHKKSHEDPQWARENLPWHYDHHMGPNQDANWCVTRPWFDILMGTREPYVGTEAELARRPKQIAAYEKVASPEKKEERRLERQKKNGQSLLEKMVSLPGKARETYRAIRDFDLYTILEQ